MIWEKVIENDKLYYRNDLKHMRYFDYVDNHGTRYNFEVNMRTLYVNIRWDQTNIITKFEFLVDDHEGCMGFFISNDFVKFIYWMRLLLEFRFLLTPANWKHRNYLTKFVFWKKL